MKGSLYLKTAPVTEPVTTAEAKLHLRVDITDDDTLIANLVAAARRWIEDVTGIRMVTQTWNYYLDEFPDDSSEIKLPIGPVASLTSIKYTDTADTVTTWAATNYRSDLVSLPARIVLRYAAYWPTADLKEANGIDIEFVCGYLGSSSLVAARASLAAAEVLVAAAVTAGEITAAKAALAAAAVDVAAAEALEIAAIPEELKLAIKLLVEHWYEHRGAVTELRLENAPLAIQALLSNFRMWQREM